MEKEPSSRRETISNGNNSKTQGLQIHHIMTHCPPGQPIIQFFNNLIANQIHITPIRILILEFYNSHFNIIIRLKPHLPRSQLHSNINPMAPNDVYICRTAQLTSRRCILNIYSTNILTEYFKHAAHSQFFSLQDAVYFIKLSFLVPVIFTF